jgi:hypothetical protein
MKYYVHTNELIDGQLPYSKNILNSFNSVQEMFYFVRDLIFSEDEDEDDSLHLSSEYLFEDLNIEISIFNHEMKNIFNFGKLHQNKWIDFQEEFGYDSQYGVHKNESNIIKFSKFFESKKVKFPDIKKYEYNGFIIYMGRDAKSNDYLTFNMADKEDIWLHTKGVPGSHVVIRVSENLPTDDVIRYAAEIAKKNSKFSKENNVTVVYCQRRFVKKGVGMNDGQVKVDYINSYEIKV